MAEEQWTEAKIDQALESIFLDKSNPYHQAYFDSGHILHSKAVGVVENLSRMKIGDSVYDNEGAMVVSQVGDVKLKS